MALGVGAVLLLLLAATLPAAAAGWGTVSGNNQTAGDGTNCPCSTDCEQHQYRHQTSVSAGISAGPNGGLQQGSQDGAMVQAQNGYHHGTGPDGDAKGNGTCDQKQLRDGSCGQCTKA